MSDVPQGPGWWQASDGRWYPPEQMPSTLAPLPPPAGPPPTGPYPGNPFAYGVPLSYVPPRTEPLAIVALVLGIVSLAACGCLVFGVLAVVFGIMGRKRIREANGTLTGDGLALAGLITGAISLVVGVAYLVFYVFAFAASTSYG